MEVAELCDFIGKLSKGGLYFIPLGKEQGKKPLVKFANIPLPVSVTIDKIKSGAATSYGIRLKNLTIIDIDEDNPRHIKTVEEKFGRSGFIVKTKRGYHLYYKGVPNRSEQFDFAFDYKSGFNSFVLGPHSCRPDGTIYTPISGSLSLQNLTSLQNISCAKRLEKKECATENKIQTGKRHSFLMKQCIELAKVCNTKGILLRKLIEVRDKDCDNPKTFTNKELEDIVTWAWDKKSNGDLYGASHSEFKFNRKILECFKGNPQYENIITIYCILASNYGHKPEYSFSLCHRSMKSAQLITMGRDSFRKAIRSLLKENIIEVASKAISMKRKTKYRLVI